MSTLINIILITFSLTSIFLFCIHLFFFSVTQTTEFYTLSLHDALPISHLLEAIDDQLHILGPGFRTDQDRILRSEEHTSELQSPYELVCRLLLEKKKKIGRPASASLNAWVKQVLAVVITGSKRSRVVMT